MAARCGMSTRGHWDGPVICNQGTRYKVEPFVGAKMWFIAIIAIILRIIPIIVLLLDYFDDCVWIFKMFF